MAFDENLADRVRRAFDGTRVTEKKMFGGLSFMLRGHMCVGVIGAKLMVRVGPDAYEKALQRPHVRPMDFTGKPLRGYVYVAPEGHKNARALRAWIDRGVTFVRTLPAK